MARPARFIFVPADYRLPAVVGWKIDGTFEPDAGQEMIDANGVLYPVELTKDTPTSPPPPMPKE